MLDTHTLACGILRTAGLADLSDASLGISHNLHFLLTQFMAVERQGTALHAQNGWQDGRIAEDVAVHEQEFASVSIGACEPEGEDVIVVGVVGIVDEVDGER